MEQIGSPIGPGLPALLFGLLVGGVLLLSGVALRLATGRRTDESGAMTPVRQAEYPRLAMWAAGLSVAAGLIHLVAAPAHLQEWWGYGYFFLAAGIGQVLYGLFLFRDSHRGHRFYLAGLVGTLAILVLYLVTRTVGIPLFGPAAGEVEQVGALDVPSKLVELALVVVLAMLLHAPGTEATPGVSTPGAVGPGPDASRRDEQEDRPSRRLLVAGLAGASLGLVGLVASARGRQSPATRLGASLPRVTDLLGTKAGAVPFPWEDKATGQIREFRLSVDRVRWEVAPGQVADALAYSGQVPGPELRVAEGDTVRVTVTNALDQPTTVHWHGVEVPVTMDGVPNMAGAPTLSQDPIPPGGAFTYEFVATPAGTRWYHAHVDELAQQGDGLVGALIVEPRNPPGPRPDREYVLVAGQLIPPSAQAAPPATSPSGMSGGMMGGSTTPSARLARDSVFVVNGKA